MTSAASTVDKVELLFQVVREVGQFALTKLGQESDDVDDDWTRTHAHKSLWSEVLQGLGPKSEPWVWDRCIRLPPISKDNNHWFPLLWIELRHDGDVALQVVVAGNQRRFGYRWEPPESGTTANPSVHGYYHAQPITSVKVRAEGIASEVSLVLKHDHICEHFPTFPIDARNGLELVNALLVSLYGPNYAVTLIGDGGIRDQVHKNTEKCGWAECRRALQGASSSPVTTSLPRGKRKKGNKRG